MRRNCDRKSISYFFVCRTSTAAERFKKWEATFRWKEDIMNKHYLIITRFVKNWKKIAISLGKIRLFFNIFTECLMLQVNIHTDKADYRNINATLLTIRCMGGGAVRPRLRFLTFTQNLQATHSWKFLTFPNFLLRMHM